MLRAPGAFPLHAAGRRVFAGRVGLQIPRHLENVPPGAQLLGRKVLAADTERGEVTLSFEGRREFLNRHGDLQGGILAAMLDSTVSCAVLATLPPESSSLTLELKVSFLRPAPEGAIEATGRVLHRGRGIAFAEGALRAAGGALVATATATLRIVPAGGRGGARPSGEAEGPAGEDA